MINLTPTGGDGTSLHDVVFKLGEFYGFTNIPQDVADRYQMPQHWYGMVQAFYPANAIRDTTLIELQMLPAPGFPSILLPLPDWITLVEEHVIQLKHFQQTHRFDEFNNHLKLVIQTTEEHIELLISNPELMEDWKIHCLYPHVFFDQRVKATYDWLTSQSEWFDIDPNLVDWILLVQQLIQEADHPTGDDEDIDEGIPVDIY